MAGQVTATNQWIDRYVSEVGRMLPAGKRADVELEIRSLIEEEVDARAGSDSRPSDETVLDVLRSFGHPQEIAARYGAQQYLIGPALYPSFMMVLRVVLAATLALNLVAQAFSIAVAGEWPSIGTLLTNLFFALATA